MSTERVRVCVDCDDGYIHANCRWTNLLCASCGGTGTLDDGQDTELQDSTEGSQQ